MLNTKIIINKTTTTTTKNKLRAAKKKVEIKTAKIISYVWYVWKNKIK